jgi:hypothetical protein
MHLIDAIRFRKIQVIKLSNRGLRTKQIVDHISKEKPSIVKSFFRQKLGDH